MTFLRSCIDFLTHVLATPLFSPENFGRVDQIPLSLPHEHDHTLGLVKPYPALDPRSCRYPALEAQGYRLCNDKSKSCWLKKPYGYGPEYTVKTDYENLAPTGVVREYWVTVDPTPNLSPDGQKKINGVAFNGTYPGPTIEACWGDEIVVHVTNRYKDNGTTVHWHGIRQLGSNEMDGVNGITQCPIAYSQEYTYRFNATQYGHTWYHSHYSLQYPDGVAGPLVIHGPTSEEWDIDVGPILMADWIHDTAFDAFNCEAYSCGVNGSESPPKSDTIVVNGIGPFKQSDGKFTNNYFKAKFQPGKKHLLRLINVAAASSFVFSIDNHTMTVVANDLVAVKPYTTNSVLVGIGQRYTVVVEANQKTGSYWMRTAPADGCHSFRTDPTTHAFTQVKETSSFIVYEGAPPLPFPDSSSVKQPNITTACTDETEHNDGRLEPVVRWDINPTPTNNVSRDSFTAALESFNMPWLVPDKPYAHWLLANDTLSNPLWIDFGAPTILHPLKSDNFSSIIRFDQSDGFVFLIIDSFFLFNPNGLLRAIPISHPIHLHGSDFVILAQNRTKYDPKTSPKFFNFDNPPRRDVAMLPGGGYLALAFKPDNPGAWLMHCHIAWHASSGLALQLVVRPKELRDGNGDLGPVIQGCRTWNEWAAVHPFEQTDSGI
ncbi:multicopper oxidase-domain-containing protein [Echria macrotheca]|uniref:Multicopper oxidase-domain-containing protein n=1 Tax=Echria macrotheca TaxID=438768 RepID=A0AAJ0BDN8_9PEZI|nr:multicopper oxidase-domain-containing protein [Echria macrotheca]